MPGARRGVVMFVGVIDQIKPGHWVSGHKLTGTILIIKAATKVDDKDIFYAFDFSTYSKPVTTISQHPLQ